MIDLLLKKKYEVHGLYRKSSVGNTSNIDHLIIDNKIFNKSFYLHKGDLLDTVSLHNIINDIKNSNNIYLIQSSNCERGLSDHYSDLVPFFKSNILIEENMDSNDVNCIKESVLKINPNINIKVSSYSLYNTLVEELKTSA